MKIHAYKVAPRGASSLEAVLTYVSGLPLTERKRGPVGQAIRLESAQRRGAIWLLDFALISRHGPGRAPLSGPIADFEMGEDDGFGHETACVYDPSTNFAVMQYNHTGARVGKIQAYLYRFSRVFEGREDIENTIGGTGGFSFDPVLRQDSEIRLDRMRVIKKIEVSMYVPGVVPRETSPRQSLGSLLNNPVIGAADKIKFEISARRGRGFSLAVSGVRDMVNDLLGLEGDVRQLNLVAKEDDFSPSEPIDLIEARLSKDASVPRGDRRPAREERWAALEGAYADWLEEGQLA